MKRDNNIRVALSDEEYSQLKRESERKGIPMTGIIRQFIQTLPKQPPSS